jgi:hypothetical protein
MTPTGGVSIRVSRVMYLSMLPFGLAFMAPYVWLLLLSMNVAPEFRLQLAALGVVGIVLFGGVSLFIVWLVLSSNRLVIDEDGFVDQINWFGADRVQWRDVRGTRLVSIFGFKILVIDVHDPQKFARRGNVVQRSMKRLHRWMFGSPVTIPLLGLDARADAVKAIIDGFFDRAVGRANQ